jgi:hypothetical protein
MRRIGTLTLALVAAAAASGISAAPAQGPGDPVRVAYVDHDAELERTIPISKRKNQKPRVVMSIDPQTLGNLQDNDRLEGTAEVEVSVCLKPAPHTHDPSGRCIGKTYGYNPRVQAKIVLAQDKSDAGGGQTKAFQNPDSLSCYQRQPNRNHHCVLVIEDGLLEINKAQNLPCQPATCRANLVMTAYHRDAKRGDKLVIGSDTSSGGINQDKGRLDVARFRPGDTKHVKPKSTGKRRRTQLPIAPENKDVIEKVIYSVPLDDLSEGEQLVVDGQVAAKIGQHPYNTFMATKVILATGPNSVKKEHLPGMVTDHSPELGKLNGFNCTQGRSAHPDPCTARKVGSVRIDQSTNQTLFLNLVTGMNAQLFGERHRNGDDAKILDRGFLKVYRYPNG